MHQDPCGWHKINSVQYWNDLNVASTHTASYLCSVEQTAPMAPGIILLVVGQLAGSRNPISLAIGSLNSLEDLAERDQDPSYSPCS